MPYRRYWRREHILQYGRHHPVGYRITSQPGLAVRVAPAIPSYVDDRHPVPGALTTRLTAQQDPSNLVVLPTSGTGRRSTLGRSERLGDPSSRTKKVPIVMSLRLVRHPQTTNVVQLPQSATTVEPPLEVQTPEPHQLYHLVLLALFLHQPATDWLCQTCEQLWPCQQVRLAYRLREGF